MDRSTPIYLIGMTYSADAIGQRIPTDTSRKVYANVRSVTRSEWATAGQMGLKPELMAVIFEPDYQGEEIVEINSKRYGVYRTFHDANDRLELYLEEKAGV